MVWDKTTGHCSDVIKNLQESLPANLRFLRLASGLSQQDISSIIFISRSQYNRIERGHMYPDVVTLCLLAGYYGVSVNDLVGLNKGSDPLQPPHQL